MYYAFSFLNPATLKGKLKFSIKTDILLTHAGHVSSLMEGPIIQPEVGPIISPEQEVGPIISPRQEMGPIIFCTACYKLSTSLEQAVNNL